MSSRVGLLVLAEVALFLAFSVAAALQATRDPFCPRWW
jgi:hypothetical protein